jgi:hypothetical protein
VVAAFDGGAITSDAGAHRRRNLECDVLVSARARDEKRNARYTTFLKDEDFGHESFMARMEQGSESARVIALLSKAYQRSEYTRKEYNTALAGDPLNTKERLIVLRVEDCAPSGNLRDLAYDDLVPGSLSTSIWI